MNKFKRFSHAICLVMLGIGIVLLGVWDMQHAQAAAQPNSWLEATPLDQPLAANLVQCPDDPDGFYMVGGILTGNVTTDQLSYYDIADGNWTTLAPMPAARRAVASTCYQGRIYVAGGVDYYIYDNFYIYDISTDVWATGPSLPDIVWGAAMGAWDGKLFLVGGTPEGDPYTPVSRVDVFNLALWEWTAGGGQDIPYAASFFGSVQTGQYLYAVGGYSGDFAHNIDRTQRYNMATDQWEEGPFFTSARALLTLAATNAHLYALGGDMDGGGAFDQTDLVEELDLSAWPAGSWTDLNDPLPDPNFFPATTCSEVLTGGEIWSVGGVDDTFNVYDTNYYRPTEACYDWPPQVLALNPIPNSHDAGKDTPISITYDQDMDPATVDAGSFAVHARQTGRLNQTLSVDGGTIALQPTAPLHAGELVQVTATTATLTLDGEAPVEPTVWEFTTAPWGGNGSFSEHQILENDLGRFAALGDLDGDGDLDAIGVSCLGITRVYFNDGFGTFTEVQSFNHVSYCLLDVDLGDLDGDGDLDAFLTDYNTPGSNFILFNDGTGYFTITEAFPANNEGYTELGDLDGDGDLDIFTATGGWYPGTLHVWKNDGAGNFTLTSDFGTAFERTGLALGDLDNDGDLDAFIAGWNNTYNEVWLNDGTGSFSLAQAIPNTNTYTPILGDLDGDGDLDAYLSNVTYGLVNLPDEVWLNDGVGNFIDSGQRLETVAGATPALGDLDADSDLDVYLSGDFNIADQDEVWVNDGTGVFTLLTTVDENNAGGFVTLGDLDNDGDLDAFVTSQFEQYGYQVYLNSGWIPSDSLPEPLAGYSVQCPELPDIIYMVGGVNSVGTSNKLYKYDATNNNGWQRLADMPIALRGSGVTCYHGKIYVAGGLIDAMNLLFIYDIAGDTWTSGANLPDPTAGPNLGAWDGKLYLMGGSRLGGPPYTPIPRVDVYDIATNTWTVDGGTPMPTATAYVSGVQRGSYYYITGGGSGDYNNNVDQTQRYNMATDSWQLGPTFTSQRGINAHAMNASTLFVQGGDVNGGGAFDPTDLVEDLDLSAWPGGAWNDLGDPLPQPSLLSAGACTEAKSGGEIWAIGGADDQLNPFADVYYRPSGPCVSFGVTLSAPPGQFGEAGTTVEYLVTITNTGVVTDYYTMDVSTTWNIITPEGGPGPIGPGESLEIIIAMDIPAGAPRGQQGVTEITATSISNPAEMDTTSITTTVGEYLFEVQPIPPDSQEGHPGNVLTYTLWVSNTGDFEDSYNVAISATWETTASLSVGPILPGEGGVLVVVVTIPQDAMQGDWDFAIVTLSSQAKPEISHAVKLTSTAVMYRMLMPLAMKN
jgi:hypothetical protein